MKLTVGEATGKWDGDGTGVVGVGEVIAVNVFGITGVVANVCGGVRAAGVARISGVGQEIQAGIAETACGVVVIAGVVRTICGTVKTAGVSGNADDVAATDFCIVQAAFGCVGITAGVLLETVGDFVGSADVVGTGCDIVATTTVVGADGDFWTVGDITKRERVAGTVVEVL